MPTTLIPTDSPLYMRRLVREINRRIRNGDRVSARPLMPVIGNPVYRVRYVGGADLLCNGMWPARYFWDGNGEEIVASREE